MPAAELAAEIRGGNVSPVTVVETYLDRLHERNQELNAYVTVTEDSARESARAAERAIARGDAVGPLHGVPVALKDLTAFKSGVRHTFGCRAFADNVANRTAVFVERLEDAGAIVLGKTNTPEFGHKPMTDNMLIGPTATPFDPARNAGGSSGGSAAAVAAGMTAVGQGGDAAGSVRIPAALCGVYGLKPSFGRIPQPARPDGFRHHTPFVDKGVLTRTVRDAALVLDVMAGPHPRDPFSLPDDGSDFLAATDRPIDDVAVGFSPNLDVFPVEDVVDAVVRDAVTTFEDAGATLDVVAIDLGHSLDELRDGARWPAMQLFSALVASSLADGYGVDVLGADREDVPEAFVSRVEAGRTVDAGTIDRLDRLRTDVFDAVQDVFDEFDLLVSPTVSVPPFLTEEGLPTRVDGTDIDPYSDWILTWPFNLTGHPAASIPAGFTDDGLPIGLQIVGPRFGEELVLAASAAFERLRPWQGTYSEL